MKLFIETTILNMLFAADVPEDRGRPGCSFNG